MQNTKKLIGCNTIKCKYFIVATIEHYEDGVKISSNSMMIGRSLTLNDAERYKNNVTKEWRDVHIGFEKEDFIYENQRIRRKKYTGYRNKKSLSEKIKSIDILTKSEYIEYLKSKLN